MRILLVHNRYREAGGEDVVFESEKRLLERAGHQVVAFERSNQELKDNTALDRVAIASQMVWSWRSRNQFAAVLDEFRPDIVHVHNSFMVISPSIFSLCTERGIPVVQTLHNFRLICPAGTFFRDGNLCHDCVKGSLLESIRHGCYRHSRAATSGVAAMLAVHRMLGTWHRHVTRFIALTEFAKQKFVEGGFSAEQFVVKPNFADPDPQERTNSGDYAVYVGRLTEEKGLHILLDAWDLLPKPYPMYIVGDGPERAALEEKVRERKLAGITFRGWVPRAESLEIVKGARFIVVPSIWYEGFPMTVVEAFACGTPVICSRLGGLGEIVQDNATGLHFHPGDPRDLATKVEWAWSHEAEMARMGHSARSTYEKEYTAEKNYSQLCRIYEEALASRAYRGSRSCQIPLQSTTR